MSCASERSRSPPVSTQRHSNYVRLNRQERQPSPFAASAKAAHFSLTAPAARRRILPQTSPAELTASKQVRHIAIHCSGDRVQIPGVIKLRLPDKVLIFRFRDGLFS